ncbi:hypothetical protein RDI58_007144 [Solanum bulbocastanum]|uniref:Uncharacterized protein n=1 Tax=Solanum bulbocastanum TaxID=147425 RepID=A0AAN8YIY2_SOLBU
MEIIRKKKEDLYGEVFLLRWEFQGTINPIRMKVPKLKAYNGVGSAKELENFIWDIENYFKASKVLNGEKVSVTTMYLSDDAKVLWRKKSCKSGECEYSTNRNVGSVEERIENSIPSK